MKVYLLIYEEPGDHYRILGVFASNELAEKAFDKLGAMRVGCSIEEHDVITEQE